MVRALRPASEAETIEGTPQAVPIATRRTRRSARFTETTGKAGVIEHSDTEAGSASVHKLVVEPQSNVRRASKRPARANCDTIDISTAVSPTTATAVASPRKTRRSGRSTDSSKETPRKGNSTAVTQTSAFKAASVSCGESKKDYGVSSAAKVATRRTTRSVASIALHIVTDSNEGSAGSPDRHQGHKESEEVKCEAVSPVTRSARATRGSGTSGVDPTPSPTTTVGTQRTRSNRRAKRTQQTPEDTEPVQYDSASTTPHKTGAGTQASARGPARATRGTTAKDNESSPAVVAAAGIRGGSISGVVTLGITSNRECAEVIGETWSPQEGGGPNSTERLSSRRSPRNPRRASNTNTDDKRIVSMTPITGADTRQASMGGTVLSVAVSVCTPANDEERVGYPKADSRSTRAGGKRKGSPSNQEDIRDGGGGRKRKAEMSVDVPSNQGKKKRKTVDRVVIGGSLEATSTEVQPKLSVGDMEVEAMEIRDTSVLSESEIVYSQSDSDENESAESDSVVPEDREIDGAAGGSKDVGMDTTGDGDGQGFVDADAEIIRQLGLENTAKTLSPIMCDDDANRLQDSRDSATNATHTAAIVGEGKGNRRKGRRGKLTQVGAHTRLDQDPTETRVEPVDGYAADMGMLDGFSFDVFSQPKKAIRTLPQKCLSKATTHRRSAVEGLEAAAIGGGGDNVNEDTPEKSLNDTYTSDPYAKGKRAGLGAPVVHCDYFQNALSTQTRPVVNDVVGSILSQPAAETACTIDTTELEDVCLLMEDMYVFYASGDAPIVVPATAAANGSDTQSLRIRTGLDAPVARLKFFENGLSKRYKDALIQGVQEALRSTAGAHETAPSTDTPDEMTTRVCDQVHYYFSNDNIDRPDEFLVGNMQTSEEGVKNCVRLTLLAGFRNVTKITPDFGVFVQSLRYSPILKITTNGNMVYRERPYSFAEVRSMPLKSHTTVTMETKPNMDVDGDCDQNELKVAHAYVYYAQGIYVDTPAHTPMGLTCTTMAQAVGGQKWVYGHTDCPTYHALVAPAIGDAGPRKEEEERPKNACFNCDSVDHAVRDCHEPRDPERIARLSQEMRARMGNSTRRYHVDDDEKKYRHLVPGIIGNELKEALGMITSSTNVPPYYENMLMYGYPPAYITTSERFRREQAGAEQLRKDIANTTITIHLGIDSDSDGDANVADQPASLCTNTNGVESVTDVPVTGSEVVDNGNKPQRIASTRTSASQLRGLDVSPSRMDLSENEDMDVLASVNMDMSDSESESELETRSETVVEGRVEAIATTPTPDDTVGGRQVSELTTIPTTTPGDSAVAKASERVDTIVGASEGVDTMAQPPADGIDASQRNQITNEYPHAYARANELALGNRYFDRLVEFGRTEKPAHHMYAYMGLNTPPHSIEEMVDYPWNPYSPYFDVEKEQWKQSQVFYFWRQKAMRDNATSGVTTDYPHPRMYHPTTANTHTPQGILPQPHPPTHPLLQQYSPYAHTASASVFGSVSCADVTCVAQHAGPGVAYGGAGYGGYPIPRAAVQGGYYAQHSQTPLLPTHSLSVLQHVTNPASTNAPNGYAAQNGVQTQQEQGQAQVHESTELQELEEGELQSRQQQAMAYAQQRQQPLLHPPAYQAQQQQPQQQVQQQQLQQQRQQQYQLQPQQQYYHQQQLLQQQQMLHQPQLQQHGYTYTQYGYTQQPYSTHTQQQFAPMAAQQPNAHQHAMRVYQPSTGKMPQTNQMPLIM